MRQTTHVDLCALLCWTRGQTRHLHNYKKNAHTGVLFIIVEMGRLRSRRGFDGRNHIESADEMVRRGRGNFRVATRKLSVTSPLSLHIYLVTCSRTRSNTPTQLCKELGGLRFVGDGEGERRRRFTPLTFFLVSGVAESESRVLKLLCAKYTRDLETRDRTRHQTSLPNTND